MNTRSFLNVRPKIHGTYFGILSITKKKLILGIGCVLVSCSNDYVDKTELLQTFKSCSNLRTLQISPNHTCSSEYADSKNICDNSLIDPSTAAQLESQGSAQQLILKANIMIPIYDKSGKAYSIPFDRNTVLEIRRKDGSAYSTYLWGDTWFTGSAFAGLKSRILLIQEFADTADIAEIQIHSEFTTKRERIQGCTN